MDFTFGIFILREEKGQLLRHGELVTTTPKVLLTLLALVSARGQVVTREELLQAVWPDSFVEQGSLAQNIFVLRKLLAPDFPDGNPIETLSRVGYRFRVPVKILPRPEVLPSLLPDSRTAPAIPQAHPETVLPVPTSSPRRHGNRVLPAAVPLWGPWALLGMLLILIASVALVRVRAQHRRQSDLQPAHPAVAVLRFRNLAPSPDSAWLSVGLREMLSTELTAGTDLQVLPEENVDRAERELRLTTLDGLSHRSVAALCTDLGCSDVVSGSYLRSDGQIRLDLHLVDARTGSTLASYTISKPEAQLATLVNDGGQSLRAQFGLTRRTPDVKTAVAARISTNPQAYQLYVEGNEALLSYNAPHAAMLLQQAIALDPGFALAHSSLAGAYALTGYDSKADAEADRALALDSRLPRVDQLNIQGRAEEVRHQYAAEADTYRTLFTFYPAYFNYGLRMSIALGKAGRSDEEAEELRQLMQRPGPESHDPQLFSTIADARGRAGDYSGALLWAQRAAEESKKRGAWILYGRELTSISQAQMHMHQLGPALTETQEALKLAQEYGDISGELRALNRLGEIYTVQQNLPEARQILERALEREQSLGEVQRRIHTLSALGTLYSAEGQHTQALQAFEREVDLARSFGQPNVQTEAANDLAGERSRAGEVAMMPAKQSETK